MDWMSDGIGLEGDKHPYYDFKEDGYDFKGVSFLDLLDMIPVIGTAVRCTGAVIDPNSDEMSAQCALNAAFDAATFASGGLDLPAVEAAKVAAKAAEKVAAREAVEAAERAIEPTAWMAACAPPRSRSTRRASRTGTPPRSTSLMP